MLRGVPLPRCELRSLETWSAEPEEGVADTCGEGLTQDERNPARCPGPDSEGMWVLEERLRAEISQLPVKPLQPKDKVKPKAQGLLPTVLSEEPELLG